VDPDPCGGGVLCWVDTGGGVTGGELLGGAGGNFGFGPRGGGFFSGEGPGEPFSGGGEAGVVGVVGVDDGGGVSSG